MTRPLVNGSPSLVVTVPSFPGKLLHAAGAFFMRTTMDANAERTLLTISALEIRRITELNA